MLSIMLCFIRYSFIPFFLMIGVSNLQKSDLYKNFSKIEQKLQCLWFSISFKKIIKPNMRPLNHVMSSLGFLKPQIYYQTFSIVLYWWAFEELS